MAKTGLERADAHRIWPAIRRGLVCRCPNCGKAKLFVRFIEQADRCAACGEPLGQYNAGLLLPFIVIMIVAHVLILVMLAMEVSGRANPLVYLSVLIPLSIMVPLAMLRPVKGAIIGILWARQLSDEQGR
ncbi:MAG TPA: DUF983 domain-containing protein [Devosia sp.]|jgi:uncharacterized protein (DUF983 family)|uniref:DUF983 domain-containing protein n=1 Tax=Devosia sp. TaxID=1871048 RepID=UPI002DDCB82B|nr:DUF983 domain-containing protein [Devosia sp.]HEV2515826.1 DUF983 domain-containing protein [Devosia sp.]